MIGRFRKNLNRGVEETIHVDPIMRTTRLVAVRSFLISTSQIVFAGALQGRSRGGCFDRIASSPACEEFSDVSV